MATILLKPVPASSPQLELLFLVLALLLYGLIVAGLALVEGP
jgi:hypothetical protein